MNADVAAALTTILPPDVAAVEVFGADPDARPLPEEQPLVSRAVEKRRREFATGRACARRALSRLGVTPGAIMSGRNREPLWPAGVVGSITHCPGYCAAAVADARRYACVGIDAEVHDALPEGVLGHIAFGAELEWARRTPVDGLHVDRLLFSAKESVYKAWYPLTGAWLGFEDAALRFDLAAGTFRARLLVGGAEVDGAPVTEFAGRFTVVGGHVLTAIAPRRTS